MDSEFNPLQQRLEQLEQSREHSEQRYAALERRSRQAVLRTRVQTGLALLLVTASILLAGLPGARADNDDKNGLKQRVEALEKQVAALATTVQSQNSQISTLQTTVQSQAGQISALQGQVGTLQSSESALQTTVQNQASQIAALGSRDDALETKTQYMSVANGDTIFEGTNLIVRSGTAPVVDFANDTIDFTPNGKGNLIIGYNLSKTIEGLPDKRTGSHNLIVGDFNDYTSFGGIVAGLNNSISGKYACVGAGDANTASGDFSCVSGGFDNTASGPESSVSGGGVNKAVGSFASVSGGQANTANGEGASLSGGSGGTANGFFSSVSGGQFSTAGGFVSSVAGGLGNNALGDYSSLSGGNQHTITGNYNWAAGNLFQAQ